MTGIPPNSYLTEKLMHTYSYRLRGLPPNATVHTILTHNQCRYWPEYAYSITTLIHALAHLGLSTYRLLDPCTAGSWKYKHLTYLLNPPPYIIALHKESLKHHKASNTHIFIHYTIHYHLHLIFSKDNNPYAMELQRPSIICRPYAEQSKMP